VFFCSVAILLRNYVCSLFLREQLPRESVLSSRYDSLSCLQRSGAGLSKY
jgi:hypothetical protein